MAKSNGKKRLVLKLLVAAALIAVVVVAVLGSQGGWFQGRLFGGQRFVTTQRTVSVPYRVNRLEYRITQPSNADFSVGAQDEELLKVRFDNKTTGALKIQKFNFLFAGNGLGNFEVGAPLALPGTVSVQNNAKYSGGMWWHRATITLTNPYTITTNDAKAFYLLGDVTGGSGSNVRFDFERVVTDKNVSLYKAQTFTPAERVISGF